MCLATTYPPVGNAQYRPGGAASAAGASIADSSSFSAPSVIEERANGHRVREVTERHMLLPMASSCEEDDWDEPAPTATNEGCICCDETIDPILTMRDSEDNDSTMDGADLAKLDDDGEEEGITINICGVSFWALLVVIIASFPLITNSNKSFLLLTLPQTLRFLCAMMSSVW